MLDTVREVETPEGVSIHLRLAGVMVRSVAWLVDFLIRAGFVWFVAVVTTIFGKAGSGITLILLFLIFWWYPVFFEVLNRGQTIGKRVMGIRVVNDNGTPIGWIASILRNLLRTADMFPAFYSFGLISMLVDRDFRRLGDIVAGTVVIYADGKAQSASIPVAPPLMPPVPLSAEEQSALQIFVERCPRLTQERQIELTDMLEPVTGAKGETGLNRVFSYANWIVGRT